MNPQTETSFDFHTRIREGLHRAHVERARSFHALLFGRLTRERSQG